MDINGGSNELWLDSGGHITQVNTSGVNEFAAPISVGNHGTLPISNTQLVVQDNGPNEVTSPLGLGAGHAGNVIVQTPTIGAPVVINFATGAGSNTYSYVCAGTDYDGNLISGTTTTITGVPTVFGGPNPFIGVSCPWSAGVYSFQVYRTAGGPSQGLMNSTVGNPGGFTDFNGAASGRNPTCLEQLEPEDRGERIRNADHGPGPTNISTGTGAPSTTCGTAPIGSGSLWLRTDGGASTSLYSCAGTTWTAVTIP